MGQGEVMDMVPVAQPQQMAVARMDVVGVVQQVKDIQAVMAAVMQDGVHYGTIPGCGDKPTLLKPGAEKLCFTAHLEPDPQVEVIDLPGGHREYRVKVTLHSIVSGHKMGAGVGSATTLEGKWRYRSESTGRPVPEEYWRTRDTALLGGAEFSARKVAGAWTIFRRVEHDNPADYYNTCLKMAKKRALVDAVLTVLAASDIFTQDIEDMPETMGAQPAAAPEKRTQEKVAGELSGAEMRGHRSAPAAVGGMMVKGTVEAVSVKPKGNKTSIGLKVAGVWYNTFDTGLFAGDPKQVKGQMAVLTYTTDPTGQYRDIVSIIAMPQDYAPEGEADAEGDPAGV